MMPSSQFTAWTLRAGFRTSTTAPPGAAAFVSFRFAGLPGYFLKVNPVQLFFLSLFPHSCG
jgi:hypothetical protein